MDYLLIIAGLIVLVKGADCLIDGSVAIAEKIRIPKIIVGLTIVAFGTSLPELLVNIISASRGSTEIAFGNVIGSNIANTLLILGIASIIKSIQIKKSTVWKEIPFSLLGTIVLMVIANDLLIDKIGASSLTRIDGIVLILFMSIFMYYLLSTAITNKERLTPRINKKIHPYKVVIMISLGLLGLYFGGEWTVSSAINISRKFGASEFFISSTLIAIGTSLPELVTSVKATLRGNSDLAVGNIIGSNIFNIFWILGITSIIHPVGFQASINFDLIFLIIASIVLFIFIFIGNKHRLDRWQGAIFICAYIVYIGSLILRE